MWMLPSVIATLSGSLILTLVFFYLYYKYKYSFLGIWTISWAIYSTRFIFVIVSFYSMLPIVTPVIQAIILTSSFFLLWGTMEFLNKNIHKSWFYLWMLLILWIISATLLGISFTKLTVPIFLFVAVIYFITAFYIYKSKLISGGLKQLIVYIFIIWGFHKLDYPFLRNAEWFAPWGFLVGAILAVLAAMGFLILFFERMHTEFEKNEQKLSHIIQNMPVMLNALDEDHNFIAWNRECEQISGYKANEIINNANAFELLYPDDEYRKQLMDGLEFNIFNYRNWKLEITCKDGKKRLISWSNQSDVFPISGWHTWAVGLDVTELHAMQNELNYQKDFYEKILETVHEGIWVSDANDYIIYSNTGMAKIAGVSIDQITGQNILKDFEDKTNREFKKHYLEAKNTQKPVFYDIELVTLSNKSSFQSGWLIPLLTNNTFNGMICTIQDLTEHKQLQKIIYASRELVMKLSGITDIDSGLELFLKSIIQLSDMDSGGIYLFDFETGNLNLFNNIGVGKEFQDKVSLLESDSPLHNMLNNGNALFSHVNTMQEPFKTVLKNEGIKSFSVIPIKHKGQTLGSIHLASHQYENLSDFTQQVIEILTAQIGDTIARFAFEKTLKESELRLKFMVENLPSGAVFIEEQMFYLNPKAKDLIGYTNEEISTKTDWFIKVHPQDHGKHYKLYMQDRNKNFNRPCTVPINCKDKTVKQIEFIGYRHDPYEIWIMNDVTARVEAEQKVKDSLTEKEALLKELYHRTKNNMQVIISMLALQSASITDKSLKTIFTETENRIYSMALVHQKLYQSENLASINMADYISELTHVLINSYSIYTPNVHTEFKLQPIPVILDIAIPCGLLVNEIISNAFKHAFPDNMSGTITIEFFRNKNNTLDLVISDNGVGLIGDLEQLGKKSLGIQLIYAIAEKQLKGKAELTKLNSGLKWAITFKDRQNKTTT